MRKTVTIERIFSVVSSDGKVKHYRGRKGMIKKNINVRDVLLILDDGEELVVPKIVLKKISPTV